MQTKNRKQKIVKRVSSFLSRLSSFLSRLSSFLSRLSSFLSPLSSLLHHCRPCFSEDLTIFLTRFSRQVQRSVQKGFTVIELLAVAAIFTILTSIIIFNYGDFTDNVLATNMAYEIALVARQAQVFGLGARGVGSEFRYAYGIFINTEDGSHDEGTKNVIFFSDNKNGASGNSQCNDPDGDGYCTCGSGDECLEKLTLQRNIHIADVKVKNSGACALVKKLAVSFKRPNPDAIIVDQEKVGTSYELAEIRIESPRNDRSRYVIIRNTGQISVEQTSVCSPSTP